MKTIPLQFIAFGLFATGLILIVVALIRIVLENKKLINENKSKQNRYLEYTDIPGEEIRIQYSEQPFIEGVTSYN